MKSMKQWIQGLAHQFEEWKHSRAAAISAVMVAALSTPGLAHANNIGALANGWTTQVQQGKVFVVALAGLTGISMVFYGLYQATLGHKNDPHVKVGQSIMIAVAGGILAAIIAFTGVLQDSFGVQNTSPMTGGY